jgi:hypothetical protein
MAEHATMFTAAEDIVFLRGSCGNVIRKIAELSEVVGKFNQ